MNEVGDKIAAEYLEGRAIQAAVDQVLQGSGSDPGTVESGGLKVSCDVTHPSDVDPD